MDKWAVRDTQGMYSNALDNGQNSEEFGVGVGVHQRSALSPPLFILVLEAHSREFRTGVQWELLYPDDLMLIWTPNRSVSPSSKRGRLAWKVKGSVST